MFIDDDDPAGRRDEDDPAGRRDEDDPAGRRDEDRAQEELDEGGDPGEEGGGIPDRNEGHQIDQPKQGADHPDDNLRFEKEVCNLCFQQIFHSVVSQK